jgi:thiol reductant ABC exporter CydD subunit
MSALLAREPSARGRLNLAVACGLVASAAVIAGAVLLAGIVSAVFLDGAGLDAATPALAGLAALAVLRAVAVRTGDVLAQDASNRLRARVRGDLLARITALGPAWAAGERTGELLAVATGGLDAIDEDITMHQPVRALAMIVPLATAAVVLAIDPPTVLILAFTGPILVLLLALIGSRAGAQTQRRFVELRYMSAFLLDMVRGLTTLKLFGRSREQATTIEGISRRYGETTMEVLRTAFQTALVLEWGAAVAMALVAVQVSLRLLDGTLAFERALAVLIVTPEFFLPLRQLALRYHAGAAGRAAAERVLDLLDEPGATGPGRVPDTTADVEAGSGPAVEAPRGAIARPAGPSAAPSAAAPPRITLARIGLTYPGRTAPALADVSLDVPPGALVAVVGASGSGKTTLLRMLLRFLEPDAGQILADGRPIGDRDPDAWRAGVAWSPQAPHLVHGSVRDNLVLGRPAASDDELWAAARAAAADAFIRRLPGGLEAHVGEGGLRLSGGERQRLALARALLRGAPLLLLDEPTSQLDPETEAVVLASLRGLVPAHTMVAVSHRPAVAQAADLVVALSAGRIVAVGTPDEVAGRSGPLGLLLGAEAVP